MILSFSIRQFGKRFGAILLVLVAVFGINFYHIDIFAQSGNRGLIVSPIINDIDAEKGKSYSYSLDLYNDTPNYKYNIDITKQTFVPTQADGVPELANFSPENDYSNWLNFDQDKFTIDAGKKQTVQAKLIIPSDAQAGGYYFALVFGDNPDNQNDLGAGVKIKQRIVALLFVNVKGQVEKSAEFTNIETNQKVYDPFFDTIFLKYTIKVNGGTYLKPTGNVFLDEGSKAGVDLFPLNPSEKIILPNSGRSFTLMSKSNFEIPVLSNQVQNLEEDKKSTTSSNNQPNWVKPFLGSQKIEARVIYVDSDGKIAQQSIKTDIFYLPWKAPLIIAILSSVIFFVWYKLRMPKKIV